MDYTPQLVLPIQNITHSVPNPSDPEDPHEIEATVKTWGEIDVDEFETWEKYEERLLKGEYVQTTFQGLPALEKWQGDSEHVKKTPISATRYIRIRLLDNTHFSGVVILKIQASFHMNSFWMMGENAVGSFGSIGIHLIRYDATAVTVYARIAEITPEGEEVDRPDLTAYLELFSGGNLKMEGTAMAEKSEEIQLLIKRIRKFVDEENRAGLLMDDFPFGESVVIGDGIALVMLIVNLFGLRRAKQPMWEGVVTNKFSKELRENRKS